MNNTKLIGVDVGGSHVSASIIDFSTPFSQKILRDDINAFDSAATILGTIGKSIQKAAFDENVGAVGIAFPGPFDYEKGVSNIAFVGGKFESTFGLHVQQALKNITGLHNIPFVFANDAHCFAVGAHYQLKLNSKRAVFLTLGTGFGSAFMEGEELLYKHPDLPEVGAFYNEPFLDSNADDCFSTRWFLKEYKVRSEKEVATVKELAESKDDIAISIFKDFGSNMGAFLFPWLQKFKCDTLVIGGNISNAKLLFDSAFKAELKKLENLEIIYCNKTEECILTGAALIAKKKMSEVKLNQLNQEQYLEDIHEVRKTSQPLLPVSNTLKSDQSYTIFPSFKTNNSINIGHDLLAQGLLNEKTVVIDGFGGVLWEVFRKELQQSFDKYNKKVFWYDIAACLKTPEEINEMVAPSLNGDDPVFGKRYSGQLTDFFNEKKLALLKPEPEADLCIVYGTGAALSNWQGSIIYLDVPKNEIQYRMRARSITNLGSQELSSNQQMYKRYYFVDWPVLNKHKEELLNKIDYIVDEQRINEITWMSGEDFRGTLDDMLEQPFRARPWFEAGIWGGHWMKNKLDGLVQDEVNYAWSFELITPENGIVLDGNNHLLEVSFDFLLFRNNRKVLGKAAARFGNEFPIRFDFLDTFAGGNLSIQCHPRTQYIQENFGETFTQDETYYILDCEPDADVYLGFQDDINPGEFKQALLDAQNKGIEMPVEKYVQKFTANKHDLFLIPNGTVHASGKNNLVLEISSTPYIFTFKMYDWLRLDLNGQPRPINIEHAFNNLYFDRKGDYVPSNLISHPTVVKEWSDGRLVKLPTHPEHFYTVDRYEFTNDVTIATDEQCHCCMLVEGTEIEVIVDGKTSVFNYAETFVIPALVKEYTVRYRNNDKAYLVIAYVKNECCISN
ncbi:ROK family protein [Solitalea lacus]|uniref:ROK family protein n=1 Tax=Solitalea lacus TaxID=2911172 RepID=UPI001EDC5677|nr:ROK family protein [Solitalea lacus]UKJ09267.1 ROK family protein [Solitalea lacus]